MVPERIWVVWVIEFSDDTLQAPEVWASKDLAFQRFKELYEEHGDKSIPLKETDTGGSFDDAGESIWLLNRAPLQGVKVNSVEAKQ